GQNQAIRNANDGIALAQTADGYLGEVTNILQRLRELSVQSASGTYQNSDRTNLQTEVSQLTSQLTTLNGSKFNGVQLFGTTD
ncbi:flagellin, partial [Acinetobacter baumannii]